jgi:hypothetical protein
MWLACIHGLAQAVWSHFALTALRSDGSQSDWPARLVKAGRPYAILVKAFIGYYLFW